MRILERLLGKTADGPPSSSAVKSALAKAQSELVTAESAYEDGAFARARILISGSEEDLDRHDQAGEKAQRDRDRLTAAIEHLEAELIAAQDREATGRLQAKVDEGINAADRYRSNLQTYSELAAEMIPVLEALRLDEDRMINLRMDLRSGDFDGQIPSPNHEFRGGHQPIHELAVIPQAFEGDPVFQPLGMDRGVRIPRVTKAYVGIADPPVPGQVTIRDGSGKLLNDSTRVGSGTRPGPVVGPGA